jgi:hypothetical protein
VKPIYVVEPHADTAVLERDLLEDAGFTVRVVLPDDARAALERAPSGCSWSRPVLRTAPPLRRSSRRQIGRAFRWSSPPPHDRISIAGDPRQPCCSSRSASRSSSRRSAPISRRSDLATRALERRRSRCRPRSGRVDPFPGVERESRPEESVDPIRIRSARFTIHRRALPARRSARGRMPTKGVRHRRGRAALPEAKSPRFLRGIEGLGVSAEGIEPSTYGLRVHCSAN